MSLFDALYLDPAPYHIWVANRADFQRGSGTVTDPYHGGMLGTASQFDVIMNLPDVKKDYAVIHLGPGVFVTKGFFDGMGAGVGWQIKKGMKICGAGIEVTTLKIDNTGVPAGKHVFAISHPVQAGAQAGTTVDAAEVSDLSIDCNCGGPNEAAFGGVRLLGNNSRVRRVQVTNWGTKAVTVPVPAFGIVCLTGDPAGGVYGIDNTGIEDCYAIKPFVGPASTVATAFAIGDWTLTEPIGREPEGKSPFIRNCYVDGSTSGAAFAPQPSLNITLPSARTTLMAMRICWCRGGVAEGNQIYNVDFGGPYQFAKSIRDLIVRNNFMKNVAAGPNLDVGQVSATSILSTPPATLTVVSNIGTVSGGGMNMTTGLSAGDRVVLVTASSFAGTYLVTSVNTAGNTFTIVSSVATGSDTNITSVKRVLGIGRVVIEGNIVEVPSGGPYAYCGLKILDNQTGPKLPDYTHGDVVIRGNKVRLIDGVVPVSGDVAYAGEIQGVKNLQVSNSVMGLYPKTAPSLPQLLQNTRCQNATYFNNRTSQGVLAQGYNQDTSRKYDELETYSEDAFVMAFAEA